MYHDHNYKIFFILFLLIILSGNLFSLDKIQTELLIDNYSEYLNFGDKKLSKLKKLSLENNSIKSKIDGLGEIFKLNIDRLKSLNKLDLIFLIDGSSSVGEYNFRSEIKFVKKFLSDVPVDYNHTRVSIITFSSINQVINNIDEIGQPKIENNKCLLLKQLNKIKYTGGGTYTYGAFKKAEDVFERSRNDSKKVLFLITDGFSNGENPVVLANKLKKNHTTIFTIGISNGNYRELYDLSTSPGQYHSYLLDSFQEFENLARRALHVDLKSGDYIPLGLNSPCDSLCEEGNCCDKNAVCTCGTTTGHYACVCPPGYYGTGFNGSCLSCPAGTYSDGPNICLPCPHILHTTTVPAIGKSACKCKRGYQSNSQNLCETVKCPKLQPPPHGYIVNRRQCGHILNSACGIRCEIGYTLVGTSIIICQENGTWSEEMPKCVIKTCPKLTPPQFGFMNCSNPDVGLIYNNSVESFPVDSVCEFHCENGKTLIGSRQRMCLPVSKWDGIKTSCREIKCPKIIPISNGDIEPISCLNGKQPFNMTCTIICKDGFQIEGPSKKICTGNRGMWNTKSQITTCKDITPPIISCPGNITGFTLPGKKFGSVSWSTVNVSDNSNMNISVWTKPAIKNITNFKFEIGLTEVTYFAQDASQNQNNCTFFVSIEDNEKPTIENCIDPPIFLSTDKNITNITWEEPYIFDNSQHVIITKTHEFGLFPMGITEVTYTALDKFGNENNCTLNIRIEEANCGTIPDPIYGTSNCSSENDRVQCVITCQEGYAVPLDQPQDYGNISINFFCNHSESLWYNNEGLMFPDCTVTEIPNEIEQIGGVSIVKELNDCQNTSLSEIENDLKLTLNEELCVGKNCTVNISTTCDDFSNKETEDSEEEKSNKIKRDTSLAFEEVPHKNTRKNNKKKKINIKFQVKGKYLNQTISSVNNRNNFTITYKTTKFFCPSGFIPRKNRCVQCPKGTFYNITNNHCESCDFGQYNDELGQIKCKFCPIYHSTQKLHSKKPEDCKEMCPPGSHARKKTLKPTKHHKKIDRITLKPYCKSCPIGYYQPNYGQLNCLKCPKGFTTTSAGSYNVSYCEPLAKEICKDETICNSGQCVPINDYEYHCKCPKGYFGSYCEQQVNFCYTNPCYNGATCHNLDTEGFNCTCPQGFDGVLCENEKNQCLLNCQNNGTCFQTDAGDFCWCPMGYYGEFCEIRKKFCENWLCENNSTCFELEDGFECRCKNGFIGRRCNLLPCDYKPCKYPNQICQNIIEEQVKWNSYSCSCATGYYGEYCEKKFDFCEYNPCLNGGKCTHNETTFICECTKQFKGLKCEFRRSSSYILNFKKLSTSNYIKLNGFQYNLSEISACLWMQTSDNSNYGTLISYANNYYDNAFTLTDYTGLVFYINNQHIVSDIYLSDGQWHHICITWENKNGNYHFYLDNNLIKNGTNFLANALIEGYGTMIIGQEQDVLGGHFSQSESFIGRMAYIDVWSRKLSHEDIQQHFENCEDNLLGDLYAWPEFQEYIRGDIEVLPSIFCSKCPEPKPLYNGVINIINNVIIYNCSRGFKMYNNDYINGRKCTKASKWEGFTEPYCRKIYCGYPGFIRNGYIIGNKYFYGNQVTYGCLEDYILIGNSTIICSETGKWYPDRPFCSGMQCKAFQQPKYSNITIIAEHSYEDFILNQSTFDIGTQIEINCWENFNLIGETIITCQENGTWDFLPPNCVSITTSTSTTITSTTITSTTTTTTKSLSTANITITSTTTPSNIKLDCSLNSIPSAPVNGYILFESLYNVGNGTSKIIEYKCRTGYKLHGHSTTTCIIDGYWTEVNISCDPIVCLQQKFNNMVINEEINKELHKYGNMLKYQCIDGYRMFGDSTIRCMANGRWTRMKGKCTKKSCRKPDVKGTTIIEGNSYFYGDNVTITCESNSKYILHCNKDSLWIGETDKTC